MAKGDASPKSGGGGKRFVTYVLKVMKVLGKVKTASTFDKTTSTFDKTATVFDKTASMFGVFFLIRTFHPW